MINLTCPKCKTTLPVPENKIGTRVFVCPKCAQPLEAPTPGDPFAPAAQAIAPGPPPPTAGVRSEDKTVAADASHAYIQEKLRQVAERRAQQPASATSAPPRSKSPAINIAKPGKPPTWLWAGIGAGVLVSVGVIVFFISRGRTPEQPKIPPGPDQVQTDKPDPQRSAETPIAELVKALKDNTAPGRKEALAELSSRGPAAKIAAAAALGDLGPQAKSELLYLRALTLDDDDGVREAAQKAMAHVEDALLGALIKRLRDKDVQVRGDAAKELTEMGERAKVALPTLIETLGDKTSNSAVRVAIRETLQAIGPQAVLVLGESLRDKKNLDARVDAIITLGLMGPDARAVLPDLIDGLFDGNATIKQETAKALRRTGDYAVPYLMEALEREKNLNRQKLLIDALEPLAPEPAAAARQALATPKVEVAKAASAVIEKMKAEPKPVPRKDHTGVAGDIQSHLRGWFNATDANKDGFLDEQELAKAMRGVKGAVFDVNPAGSALKGLTPKEFDKKPDLAFLNRVDRDNDGKVSRAEFELWAYDFAEVLKKDQDERDKIKAAQLRLQERGISQAMRLQTEATIAAAWTTRDLVWRSNIQLSHANWWQRWYRTHTPVPPRKK